jgi:hypothetical protein
MRLPLLVPKLQFGDASVLEAPFLSSGDHRASALRLQAVNPSFAVVPRRSNESDMARGTETEFREKLRFPNKVWEPEKSLESLPHFNTRQRRHRDSNRASVRPAVLTR